MSWVRTDDSFCQHPKFEGWPPARRWAWLEVMHYCARYQTGGRIPNDLSLLPRFCTKSLVNAAEKSGWVDRDSDGDLWIHDWEKYNPTDPTKAERQAKWRAKRNGQVDVAVDKSPSTQPSTKPSTSRARLPSPKNTSRSTEGSDLPVSENPGLSTEVHYDEQGQGFHDREVQDLVSASLATAATEKARA